MFEGEVVAICITAVKGTPLSTVPRIEAVAGRGLIGDRYAQAEGTFSKPGEPDREVTLIELEAVEAIAKENNLQLEPANARRNLVTKNVPLNHLVGRDFRVGEVVLHGMRLCEPCNHLEKLTTKGIREALCHRGGLRARIVQGGILKSGDRIVPS